jgi:hypothetical protein
VVVHIMTPTARQYYALEKLWRKGERVDLSDVLKPNAPFMARPGFETEGPQAPAEGEPEGPEEVDPFWS